MAPTAVGVAEDNVVATVAAGVGAIRRAAAVRAPPEVRRPLGAPGGPGLAAACSVEGRAITGPAPAFEGAKAAVAEVAGVLRDAPLPVASLAVVVATEDALVSEGPVGATPVREASLHPTPAPAFPTETKEVPIPLGAGRAAAGAVRVPCGAARSGVGRTARVVATQARRVAPVLAPVADTVPEDAAGPPSDAVARDHGVGVAPPRAGAQGDGARVAVALLGATPRLGQAALVPMRVPARGAVPRPAVPPAVDVVVAKEVGGAPPTVGHVGAAGSLAAAEMVPQGARLVATDGGAGHGPRRRAVVHAAALVPVGAKRVALRPFPRLPVAAAPPLVLRAGPGQPEVLAGEGPGSAPEGAAGAPTRVRVPLADVGAAPETAAARVRAGLARVARAGRAQAVAREGRARVARGAVPPKVVSPLVPGTALVVPVASPSAAPAGARATGAVDLGRHAMGVRRREPVSRRRLEAHAGPSAVPRAIAGRRIGPVQAVAPYRCHPPILWMWFAGRVGESHTPGKR